MNPSTAGPGRAPQICEPKVEPDGAGNNPWRQNLKRRKKTPRKSTGHEKNITFCKILGWLHKLCTNSTRTPNCDRISSKLCTKISPKSCTQNPPKSCTRDLVQTTLPNWTKSCNRNLAKSRNQNSTKSCNRNLAKSSVRILPNRRHWFRQVLTLSPT